MAERSLFYYRELVRDHILLAKPGIICLVLLTTFIGMYTGKRGLPDPAVILFALAGVGLAAGGAAILNNLFDRTIDSLMERTRKRPLPSGRIYPGHALLSGLSCLAASFWVLVFLANPLTAFLTFLSTFIYIIPYTILMKRRTPLATTVGSISGALPPVIGYAAVRAEINLEALLPFLIMYLWQYPHFWSLALKYKEDYQRAGIPVFPVRVGVKRAKVGIVFSLLLLLSVSLLPYFAGLAGGLYLVTALFLGIVYITGGLRFFLSKRETDEFLFIYSIVYLGILFIIFSLDLVGHE
ncbi:MAG: heme o synthase [Thermodesulfovibrionales bacterium]